MATLSTLVNFNDLNGQDAEGGVILDAAGNLFGATATGSSQPKGAPYQIQNSGTVYEIARSGSGYATAPTTLAIFNGSTTGGRPSQTLTAGAAGNLLSTAANGGANNAGTIFQLAKTATGYATTPTVLINNPATAGQYSSGLATDDAGDLFGATTAYSGGTVGGTVFEVTRAGNGYASTQTTLASFSTLQGAPVGTGLVLDAAGDVFGTTSGQFNGVATIFEIARSGGGYATTPTILVRFAGLSGSLAFNGLTMDSAGDIFGTTQTGGAYNKGTIFELAKTAGGYASTLTTLTSFNGTTDGANPFGTLLIDAAGNLFGTTNATAFELARSGTSYAAEVATLATFNGANGEYAYAGLTADQAGNLFGTTAYGGAFSGGTVYELTNTGFVAGTPTISGTVANQPASGTTPLSPFSHVTIADAAMPVQTLTVALSSAANGTLSNLGGGSYNAATGIYTDTGSASAVTAAVQALVFNPAASNNNVTSSFTITDTDSAGGRASDGATSVADITSSTIGSPVYRFYDPASEGHFFTSDAAEVGQLQNNSSRLVLEGPAFSAVNPTNDPAAVTVYRFYQPANGSHFYTDSQQEVQLVQATRPDMVLEGPAFSVDPIMQSGDTAVYRFYETRSDTHLYTDDPSEVASIKVNRPDLQYEGPAFYIKA